METQSQMSAKAVGSVLTAIVIAVFGALILSRIDTYLRIKAVDECAKTAQYVKEDPDQRARITYPLGDEYKACLKDKGY